ncbi:hypothetical protein [Dyella acidiphila]|uniref:DUF305 domain-containing protein n=1 Tax=Dyella acidiphila TaxID=2775866 RepID=A0ABR9GDX1_9GAMM|nr:hypothetical protein [Dyella acidiphila]MBE1162215.1 hypothetical protein [Dyella acidiphila]
MHHLSQFSSARALKRGLPVALLAGALLAASGVHAADPAKAALIHKVEIDSMKNTVFTPDSPLLDSMLGPAKAANPDASPQTWTAVRADTASAITATLFGPGSPVDAAMEQSLDQLSTPELQHLDALLTDPVLMKFQHTMASPDTQRALLQGMAASTLKMQAAMNAVLQRHSLKLPPQ